MTDHVQQVLGQAAFFQHHAHEDEQRDGQPLVVGHHAVDARGQQHEQGFAEAQVAKDEAAGRQRDAHRHAHHQQAEEAHQQADGQPLVGAHVCAFVNRRHAATPLGRGLQREQREAQRDAGLQHPAVRQPAGVGRDLVDGVRLLHIGQRVADDQQREAHRQRRREHIHRGCRRGE